MTPFALPYDPDSAPVLWIIGRGFTPAWQPADFIGARMDCPMWQPAPDANMAYAAKVPPALAPVQPFGHLGNWGTVLPPVAVASSPSAADLAGQPHPASAPLPGLWWPPLPPDWWTPLPPDVDYPCRCIVPPVPELPPVAPVPVEADAAMMLAVSVGALFARQIWRRR